uniref:mitogen-activated protein kinase kinase kinase n=1 Tax=Kalanchoe fedtschenkoi TaxID=63787 RepID=A0A7N0RFZ0_KALFE
MEQLRKLDRKNAKKHIDYDPSMRPSASTPSPVPSIKDRPRRFLRFVPFASKTSFRVQGFDGELDLIWKTLGLSGPEDLSISPADWEARKVISPPYMCKDSLTDGFEAEPRSKVGIEVPDELESLSKVVHVAEECVDLGRTENRKEDKSTNLDILTPFRNGGGGLKGQRPPALSPPPLMILNQVRDMGSSTWDLCRSFGPQDDEHVNSRKHENDGVAAKIDVAKLSSIQLRSDKSIEKLKRDALKEPLHGISPNGKFKHTISFWQKGDLLGSGSFGTVYEGFTDNGFFFAVKEVSLLDEGSQGKQSIYQLEQEISLLSRFEHENIVQYLGTDKDDTKLFIFLELVTKGSLLSLYQKYHLQDSQVSAYTRQILHGLKYLHERNVIHRDIKCANILVDVSGSVKLTDFGLAKATKLNDVKSCKGTALWMAPEVVNRKGNGYGLAADIWSLGCTVLEMLTRELPYSHLEGFQALFRIGKGELPQVPETLSKDARDFIFTCLQPDPDNRPSAAQLLEHPFVAKAPQTPRGILH